MIWPALACCLSTARRADLPQLRERLLVALDDLHVTAIEETDDWWRVFFASPADRDRAFDRLQASFAAIRFHPVDVEDEDWAARSQAGLRAVHVGGIIVAPPWDASESSTCAPVHGTGTTTGQGAPITIVIQPSMGFGTAHHASTRLCLHLLQQIDVRGLEALDIGTGSGILAIAALKLGARSVRAIDTDADAVRAARENLALNGISAGIELLVDDFRTLRPSAARVVTANLTGGLIARHAAELLDHLAASGRLIVSGVTRDEEAEVVKALGSLVVVARETEEEWVGLLLERR